MAGEPRRAEEAHAATSELLRELRATAQQPTTARRRQLRDAGDYNPEPVREKTRRQIALVLVALLFIVAIMLVALVAVSDLSTGDAKDLAAGVLSPVVAVVGTALGFYFGGHRS